MGKLEEKILPIALFSISCVLFAFAFTRCFVIEKFHIPIAFNFQGDKLFVLEKSDNTILRLSGLGEGEKLKLEKKYRIELDDADYYYMTRQMYPSSNGIVICSYFYEHKTQYLKGYRFREFHSFDEKPKDIFTFYADKLKTVPELAYCSDENGNHCILNNCLGRSNIWKIVPEGGVVMKNSDLPSGVCELGEKNTETSSWMGIAAVPDGNFFVTSADTGKIIEYSPEGYRTREIGTVGFEKNELLAPSSIFFLKTIGSEDGLLTVASSGNRSWIQFDAAGNPVKTISPLEAGYKFSDILVNRIYTGTNGRNYSFDLANNSAVIIGDKINAVVEYSEHRLGLFFILIASGVIFLYALWRHKLISSLLLKIRIPFFFKLVILFIPMLAASSYITGLWVKNIVKKNLETESLRRSANIAHAIISGISLSDFQQIQKPEDRGSPAYERIYETARRITEASNVEQTPKWIFHKIHKNRYYFGINVWRGPIFEPFIVPREREMFFKVLTEKTPQSGSFKDDQGEWFSYLQPVIDEKGKVINVLELYRPTEALNRTDKEIAFKVRCVIAGTAFFAIAALLVFSYIFTRPLRNLIKGTRIVSKGNFEHRIRVLSHDELGDLANSFNQMVVDLKKYINDLAKTTAQKEKMESELRIAHDIQMSIIPNTFPPFPDRLEFDIHATLISAKAVGGDLYDFFFIDEKHLCFAIGDVSGKGVPASLFMAVTRTLLRAKAFGCLDAGKIITEMNKDICVDNRATMFVTFFLGIFDIETGELKYSNAGHNPPFVIRKNGIQEKLEEVHGMPLGVFECAPYAANHVRLSQGDLIILYTDGITEAVNISNELYEENRLAKALEKTTALNAEDSIKIIYDDVIKFAEGAEQADDITILAINYHGVKS